MSGLDDNACGEILLMVVGGQETVYVCHRDRHSHGNHRHQIGDASAVEWRSIDPRGSQR